MQIGDASACQSPLSFGGFGAMVRHLPRLVTGLDEALQGGHLARSDLSTMMPYMPSLSAAWLFNRSMGFKVGQLREPSYTNSNTNSNNDASAPTSTSTNDQPSTSSAAAAASTPSPKIPKKGWLPLDHINRLLQCNFGVMKTLGDR